MDDHASVDDLAVDHLESRPIVQRLTGIEIELPVVPRTRENDPRRIERDDAGAAGAERGPDAASSQRSPLVRAEGVEHANPDPTTNDAQASAARCRRLPHLTRSQVLEGT